MTIFKCTRSGFCAGGRCRLKRSAPVLAESGSDDYRWLRRLLGYGLGFATGYERLKHNAHWLSDTMAGAALGTASARFTMNRVYGSGSASSLSLTPVEGGAMLTYRLTLN